MSVLVLGGTGFVGRRLVELLAADGVDTHVVNRGHTSADLPASVCRLVADRTDKGAVRRVLDGRDWDAVYDVSGVVQAANESGVESLLALLDGHVGRYVFVSSQSVYRMDGRFPWTETDPVVEPDPSTYAGFKVATEQALLARNRATGFPVAIARPAAIYGPHNNIYDMEQAMFRRLLERRPVLVPHGGLVVGSYGHVDDLCAALRVLATHRSATGEIVNVTGGAATSAAYVRTLAAVAGVEADVVEVPDHVVSTTDWSITPLCSRLFLTHHHGMLDAGKARDLLGVTPRYDLAHGHRHTLAWLRGRGRLGSTDAGPDAGPAADPMWGRTYDLDHEAAVALDLRRRPADLEPLDRQELR